MLGEYTRNAYLSDADIMLGALAPRFFWKVEVDPEASKEKGYEVKRNQPYIELYMDNGLTRYEDKVLDVPVNAERDWKRRYAPFWQNFIEGRPDEILGIPITDVFKNNPERADYYARLNVLTAEQLANTSDANINGLGMGAVQDRETAKKYIERKKSGAMYEALEREKTALELKLNEQNAKIEELMSQVQLMTTLVKSSEAQKVEEEKGAKRK